MWISICSSQVLVAVTLYKAPSLSVSFFKFIAVTTGYGRGGATPAAGFSGKPAARTPEEYADTLLELFERCRHVVGKET